MNLKQYFKDEPYGAKKEMAEYLGITPTWFDLLRLVAISDIVAEGFSPGVLERLAVGVGVCVGVTVAVGVSVVVGVPVRVRVDVRVRVAVSA